MSDPFVNGTDRKQRILLPDTLDEYVDENNPVRFIDALVDSLDMVSLGLKHSVPAGTGRLSVLQSKRNEVHTVDKRIYELHGIIFVHILIKCFRQQHLLPSVTAIHIWIRHPTDI